MSEFSQSSGHTARYRAIPGTVNGAFSGCNAEQPPDDRACPVRPVPAFGLRDTSGARSSARAARSILRLPTRQGGKIQYREYDGDSLRKQLPKAPLKYTRISSRCTCARKRPICKAYRPPHTRASTTPRRRASGERMNMPVGYGMRDATARNRFRIANPSISSRRKQRRKQSFRRKSAACLTFAFPKGSRRRRNTASGQREGIFPEPDTAHFRGRHRSGPAVRGTARPAKPP